jgi:YHS domain-containing protein
MVNGVEIYEELSKKSSKYKPNEPTNKFKTLYKHKNPLGTLYYFCKEDNPEEFEKVHNKQVYTDIFGADKFKTIQINPIYAYNALKIVKYALDKLNVKTVILSLKNNFAFCDL